MAADGKMIFKPGDRLGEYEVLAPLGAGGMGSVYKVRHAISQRLEALKVILPNASAMPVIEERFLREIRLQARLEHPHIAALHNAFRAHDELVMVMEFVEGVSLRDKLHAPGITLGQALEYVSQVLAALAYAHSHGVIHRDIKPSNVMIGQHGAVKLLDFGLATSLIASGQDAELTQPGTLVGSPYYISPEQARGEHVDARSDVYSTGAMLYEMVAGRPPFGAHGSGGAYAIIAAHLNQMPQPPSEINPEVPPEFGRIVLRALAKKPAERFQNADEFLSALEAIRLEETATVTTKSAHSAAHEASDGERSSYSEADLDRISKELVTYVGPIAHILVRRAASTNHTLDGLCETLAKEISSANHREQFLGSVRSGAA
ncbi:MAG TPA: serine/threonine-protein kinase [Bryobacteraceae bacterium]|nr:serine/threonine-protein kinase [Bryobacteraceae bacterium]